VYIKNNLSTTYGGLLKYLTAPVGERLFNSSKNARKCSQLTIMFATPTCSKNQLASRIDTMRSSIYPSKIITEAQ
jgi:hypothetical protein